jgi:ABC-2 type transport system ATP-binding protein
LIQLTAVKKSFRRTEVLRGIDLHLAKGDRVALVGSNGAGKTTLVRSLLGEYTHQGEIRIDGLPPREHRREVLRRIGFVPQLPPPLKMTVEQLVRFAADLCSVPAEKLYAPAEALGLRVDELRNRVFVRLSGGEKQKLLIGIALGRDPEILIMDEPAANLDPEARQVFFRLLAERLQQVTMIISSHRLDEVAALVNRVVELDHGRIVLDDHVDDQVDLASLLDCRIRIANDHAAFGKAIRKWGFAQEEGAGVWHGQIAGPDRLRFLGVLSRYAGLLEGLEMRETNHAE